MNSQNAMHLDERLIIFLIKALNLRAPELKTKKVCLRRKYVNLSKRRTRDSYSLEMKS